jgi:hypothetical protein
MNFKPELLGSPLAPKIRWRCRACGTSTVTAIPVNPDPREFVACRKCHRLTELLFGEPPKETS